MWQDRRFVMIKELTWHRAQFKYGEEMSFFEKVKPKTQDIKRRWPGRWNNVPSPSKQTITKTYQ